MTPEEALFEKFGQQLIERVRDPQIHYADMFLERKAPQSNKYQEELAELSPAQIEMLKKIVVQLVDGTLHDFLFLLEDADWIHLHLTGENADLADIRRATSGDLQGYVDIWAEKYSTKRMLDIS